MVGKYFQRRRFYVPQEEISRYYGRQGDPRPSDFVFPGEFENDGEELVSEEVLDDRDQEVQE